MPFLSCINVNMVLVFLQLGHKPLEVKDIALFVPIAPADQDAELAEV